MVLNYIFNNYLRIQSLNISPFILEECVLSPCVVISDRLWHLFYHLPV